MKYAALVQNTTPSAPKTAYAGRRARTLRSVNPVHAIAAAVYTLNVRAPGKVIQVRRTPEAFTSSGATV